MARFLLSVESADGPSFTKPVRSPSISARICELLGPGLGRELAEERGQILLSVKVSERIAEALPEDPVDCRKVG